ncbi:TetR/AcrR family transcriptional regulator [Minwuia sp.]|uniref:TetR/AcrR family transcriptional regulator n=1 Tax=Minwuia sp. TaxID=2493630 RepID=UPI003A95421D
MLQNAAQSRTQVERRAESDSRMISAALDLIAEHGSAGCSLAKIGVDAGYSRGLPVARFGTKLGLLEAVIDTSEAWFQRRLERELGDRTGLEALFVRIGAHLAGARDSSPAAIAVYQLYVESMGAASDLKPRMTALGESYRQGFRRHLLEAREAGELRAGIDADRFATIILGAVRGVIIQALVNGGSTDLGQVEKDLILMFRQTLSVAADRAA